MPPRDPEFGPEVGNDRLTIPCYFAKGYDDPGSLQWRQDHPDWFVAGTWTATADPDPRRVFGATSLDPTPGAPPRYQANLQREPARAAIRATAGTGKPHLHP